VDPQSEGDSPSADNFVLNYLQQGKLAYVFGSTLFVHGAISESNMGTVPGEREPVQQVHEWVRELNSWAAQELQSFAADPYSGNNRRDRKGGGLMDYGVPVDGLRRAGNEGASVVYEHFLSNGSATQLPPRVHDYLVASGITGFADLRTTNLRFCSTLVPLIWPSLLQASSRGTSRMATARVSLARG